MKFKNYPFHFKLILAAIVLCGSYLIISSFFMQSAGAFSGKCYTREGVLDQECANATKSRIIQMTYASGIFRRSRAGDNWRNYINREFTRSYRSDDNRGAQILNRNKAITLLGTQRVAKDPGRIRHLQLRAEKDAHRAKFE